MIYYTYEVGPALSATGQLRTLTFIIEWDVRKLGNHPTPFTFRKYVGARQFISPKTAAEWGFNECVRRGCLDTREFNQ